jgi:hypothetical protein
MHQTKNCNSKNFCENCRKTARIVFNSTEPRGMTYAEKMDEIHNSHRKAQLLVHCLSALQLLAVK